MKIKNKIKLKKTILISIIVTMFCVIFFMIINNYQYKIYKNNFNRKIEAISQEILNKYPNINKNDLISVLNSKENINKPIDKNIFKEYGIDIEKDSIISENDRYNKIFTIENTVILISISILIIIIFLVYNHKKDKELEEITRYIKEINKKNYKLNIDENTEDELSILKNELYKITIMLKEQAENSKEDKIKLKDSLSDISHQLKTPLTSILIMLDNIMDNPNMKKETRDEFLNDIKRKIINMNFLIQELLKLSKFDANTITFTNEKVKVLDIIENASKNVEILRDLKNVEIIVNEDNKEQLIYCDFKWQVEAITNILKNSVEHSLDNGKIEININNNKLYLEIIIKDNGNGISKKDITHIFERFYKGENSSKDSIGIGLALSKAIIEKDNGKIFVESKINKGTRFIIRYFYN